METSSIISIISIIISSLVGVILYNQIKSQKDTINNLHILINGMKSLNDLYSPDKLKSYKDIIEREAEGRYKFEYHNKLKEFNKKAAIEATEKYIHQNTDFFESYEELLNIPINIMLPMNKEQREAHLKNYPKNEDKLRSFLDAIDNGKLKSKE